MNAVRAWKILSSFGATVLGGAIGYVLPTLEDGHIPTSAMQWKALAIVAVLAGLASLLPSPLMKSPPATTPPAAS